MPADTGKVTPARPSSPLSLDLPSNSTEDRKDNVNIPYVNPRERDAERFLKLLHHKLGAAERSEIRHKRPGEAQTMSRKFFADPSEVAWCAASLTCGEVYTDAASHREEVR